MSFELFIGDCLYKSEMALSEAVTDRYPAQVFWSKEDGGFVAIVPDLPGCSSFGASRREAIAELGDAIAAWIAAACAAGNPIPHPSRPFERQSP
jgi:predicted RNase H-like HicB family nuclease